MEPFLLWVNEYGPWFLAVSVVLLDLSMPVLNGVETTKLLHKAYPDVKVIILSVYGEDRFVTHLMDLGVNAYLFKNVEPNEVEQAIRAVVDKDFYFNEAFLRAMKNRMNVRKPRRLLTDDLPATLTPREHEILALICREQTAPEMAEQLSLSIRTIDGHRANLLEKTGARNTAGLVMFAIKNHLITPPSCFKAVLPLEKIDFSVQLENDG